MKNFELSEKEIIALREAHQQKHFKYSAYHINAILLLGTGWTLEQTSAALLLDTETLRNYVRKYRKGGIKNLLKRHYKGSQAKLTDEQQAELKAHLDEYTYMDVSSIIAHVKNEYGVIYKISGMRELIRRFGFVYKKPSIVPGKVDSVAQLKHLQRYEEIRRSKKPLYFMDGCHPQHNSQPHYGWILKGKKKGLPSNSGRQRLNLNGAVNIDTLEIVVSSDDKLNSENTINFFEKIIRRHKDDDKIFIICDNAGYYHNKAVKAYLEKSKKIELVFLPPYCPHLNLIERVWKYFKKQIVYNKYYRTFLEFKEACLNFFKRRHKRKFKTLLTEKFHFAGQDLMILKT